MSKKLTEQPGEIGYCKPPIQHRFKKGQSGNPRGRPRGANSMDRLLQEELKRLITISENGKRKKISRGEAIIRQLINKALQGEPRSQKLILDRLTPSPESEDPRAKAEIEATAQRFTKMLNEVAAIKSARAYESS